MFKILLAILVYGYLFLTGEEVLKWLFHDTTNPGEVLIMFALLIIIYTILPALLAAQACLMMRRAQDLGWNRWFIVGIGVICILTLSIAYVPNPLMFLINHALMFAGLIWIVLPFVVGLLKPQMSTKRHIRKIRRISDSIL